MFNRFFCLLLLLLPINLLASGWSDLPSLLPKGTQVSYIVIDPADNRVIAQSQQTLLRTPASMQKLLTATASRLYLGADFHYETSIAGDFKRIKNSNYQGDIAFRFVGDPMLSRTDIKSMLKSLKQLGVTHISGDFLLDSSRFAGYQWSNGQAWNDLGVCYTAPANAIIVNKNCVLGNLSINKANPDKARLFIPSYEPVAISSDVAVVTKEQRSTQFCDLEVTRDSHNHYHLWGCMVPRKRAFPLAFAINDPYAYAQQVIAQELTMVGITLTGKIKLLDDNKGNSFQSILVSHQSPPLHQLLQQMMKESDNLIADSLFKTLGAVYFQRAGNFRNGASALKSILKAHGLDLENAYLADGSGLSRHNLMSAELFMSVLKYIYQNDVKLNLLSSFAVAGVDGTLKYHRGVSGQLFKGKVKAKTGSMKGVANMLGVVDSTEGDRLFVLILNGYNVEAQLDKVAQQKAEKVSKDFFQQAFFKMIMGAS